MPINEIVYNGRDNSIDLILKATNDAGQVVAVSTAGFTRIDFVVDGSVVISEINGSSGKIVWDQSVTGVLGKVIVRLGQLTGADRLRVGTYDFDLIVYDAANTNGIVWRTSKNSKVLNVVNVAWTTTTSTSTTSTTTT